MSFLKKFGQILLKIVTLGAIAAVDAEPILAIINPGAATLVGGIASSILAAEAGGASAIATAPAGDTSAQKAALVLAAITPQVDSFAKQIGATAQPTQDDINIVVASLVTFLNKFQVATTPTT